MAGKVPENEFFPGDTQTWFKKDSTQKKESGPILKILTNNKPAALVAKKPEVAPPPARTEPSEQKAEIPKNTVSFGSVLDNLHFILGKLIVKPHKRKSKNTRNPQPPFSNYMTKYL